MVNIGSVYKSYKSSAEDLTGAAAKTHIQMHQKVQENKSLQEEKLQWDRLSPNHVELQNKVEQLYELDKLLHEESDTLHVLQKDKEGLEKAIGGIRTKLQHENVDIDIIEAARKQQFALERELSRVHGLLAENSKVNVLSKNKNVSTY